MELNLSFNMSEMAIKCVCGEELKTPKDYLEHCFKNPDHFAHSSPPEDKNTDKEIT